MPARKEDIRPPEETSKNSESICNIKSAISPSWWSPGYLSLLFSLMISAFLVSFYFYKIIPYVFLPADIVMWAETNFVGDIIKLRIGAPFYTDPADSNSLVYTPAAPLLTYAISWVIGKSTSIIAWRMIQLSFVFCSSVLATACFRILTRLAYPDYRSPFIKTWLVFSFFGFLLAATAPRTNPFAYCLHPDALALLISTISFLTMLHYLKRPSLSRIIFMAVCPALGYMVKQSQISWLMGMFIFLLLNNPKDIKRLILFITIAAALIGAAIGICYLLWGDNFIFWTFRIMVVPAEQLLSQARASIFL